MRRFFSISLFILLVVLTKSVNGQSRNHQSDSASFKSVVPNHLFNIILSKPTNESISISILCNENIEGYILYGLTPAKLSFKTKDYVFEKGKPTIVELNKLQKNMTYYYQFVYKNSELLSYAKSTVNTFHTARNKDEEFVFTIQADSHLDENASTAIYEKTLQNMAEEKADFLIDLGDTWMTDKFGSNYKNALSQYIAQRYYFGLIGQSVPVFLTLGNHDGEAGNPSKKNNGEGILDWSTQTRKFYYANPTPNHFYSGNIQKDAQGNYIENYYSFEWGNSLFIVLDVFRYSKSNKDAWQRTLGKEQYNWLKQTLENSKATFKFVFIHNLVGGIDNKGRGRGGAEATKFYEWGGLNADSTDGFKTNRNDLYKPIHNLLKENHVNIVFHGHDHFYAAQQYDDIMYQLVPQPGSVQYNKTNTAKEYGYFSGKILNAPGYLKIIVKKNTAEVQYIQSSIDNKHTNKQILHTYTLTTNNQ